jgi:hypothetical protein
VNKTPASEHSLGVPSKNRRQYRALRTIVLCWPLISIIFAVHSAQARSVEFDDRVQLDAAFSAMERSGTIDDLLREARTASYNTRFVREGLWYAAALGTVPEDYVRRIFLIKNVIKLSVFATLLELASRGEIEKWPADEQLFTLGRSSLVAMPNYIAFGREGDPLLGKGDAINAWLRRNPSLDESLLDGDYHYLRINSYATGTFFLLERADANIRGLSPRWTKSQGLLDANVRSNTIPVEALSYSVPLSSTPFIIAISKAYLCLSLLPQDTPWKKYALTISGNSFYYFSRASGSDDSYQLANTASDILREAVSGFRSEPNPDGTRLTAETLQRRLTASRFFARKFSVALADYVEAAKEPNGPVALNVYGEWGAAMCLLGTKNKSQAAEHFRRVASLLERTPQSPDLAHYRYLLAALVQAQGAKDVFGETEISPNLRAAIDSWRTLEFSETARKDINLDFAYVLYTIGNYETAAKFLMREIARVHQEAAPEFRIVESDYLRELGAAISDVFSELSWTLDQDGSVRPRSKDLKEWGHQFVPSRMDDYLVGCFGTNRYGACSPEEDRATVVASYSPNANTEFGSVVGQLLQLLNSKQIDPKVLLTNNASVQPKAQPPLKDITQWVQSEDGRTPPNPVPLLKLTWVEWFYLPLSGLSRPGPSVFFWRYRPIDESGMTSLTQIETKLNNPQQPSDLKYLRTWQIFKESHDFLLKYYR